MGLDDPADSPVGSPADRRAGRAPNGLIELRAFDLGVVLRLGAELRSNPSGDAAYLVTAEKLTASRPTGFAGVPVYAANAEDNYQRYVQPCFVVRRDSVVDAPNRVQMGCLQYDAPDPSSPRVPYAVRRGAPVVGPTRRVARPQAAPHDLTYTITAQAAKRTPAQLLYKHIRACFPLYGVLAVRDSVGDERLYDCYRDSSDPVDDIFDVADRTIGVSVSFRVEGELDDFEESVASVAFAGLTASVAPR